MSDRPRGGRRSEDYPEAVQLDRVVRQLLLMVKDLDRDPPGLSRNDLSEALQMDRRKIRYSLNRLRARGLVQHIPKGNEGHGYWAVVKKENETDD
jgi:predicted transcriptional regulator